VSKPLQANAVVSTILVAGIVAAAILGKTGELKSSTTIVYEPNVAALDGQLDGQDFFGSSIAAIGDLDGNGVSELVVGATGDDDGTFTGAVWVLFLGPTGSLQSAAKVSPSSGGLEPGVFIDRSRFGSSVTGLGDIDADGVPDFAVGGDTARGVLLSQGALWMLRSNSDGSVDSATRIVGGEPPAGSEVCDSSTTTTSTSTTSTTTTTTTLPNLDVLALPLGYADGFGASVAATRDFDPSGVRLAVGAPWSDGDQCVIGATWLVDLASDGSPIDSVRATLDDLEYAAGFGSELAWLGDLDADGTVELAISAPGIYWPSCGPGANGVVTIASVATNGAIVHTTAIDASVLGASPGTGFAFGRSLAALGDLDGDGVTELAVGVSTEPSPPTSLNACEGSVWILFLASDGSVKRVSQIATDDPALAAVMGDADAAFFSFGDSVAGVGDLNGDLLPDLAIGAPWFSQGLGEARGAVFIAYLDANGAVVHARRITDETPNATTTSMDCRFGCHSSTSTTLAERVCGDVTNDATVDSTDALATLHVAIGLLPCFGGACDVNCSAAVTALDALMVLRAAIGTLTLDCTC
jgi:hypothetical protein